MRRRRRVLFLSPNIVGRRMAGVGARHLELARALAPECDVEMAVTRVDGPPPPDVPVREIAGETTLRAEAARFDVIVLQGDILRLYPGFRPGEVPVVVDLACPNILEDLEGRRGRARGGEGDAPRGGLAVASLEHEDLLRTAHRLLDAGDLFLCGSERQKDLVLGMLLAAGRLNPLTYADDPTFERLVAVVPYGVPDAPPPARRKPGAAGREPAAATPRGTDPGGTTPGAAPLAPRSSIPGIGPDDVLLYWGGGLWDWLDPETVVEAMARLAPRRPDVKLLFAGTEHPDPAARVHDAARAAIEGARRAGLEGRSVFFGSWVPYDERGAALASADIGVSAHRDGIESRFAVRTRLLDYLWAGLPIITTGGDEAADLVRAGGLGEVVPPGDVEGWVGAIARLAADPEARRAAGARSAETAARYRWSDMAAPLRRFCAEPRRAGDRDGPQVGRLDAVRRYGSKALALAREGRFDEIIRGIRWQARARWGGRRRPDGS